MRINLNGSFLKQYLKELEKLENDCNEFSEEFPNLAPNLGFGKDGTTDPHVKQLIEAVAFISARLQRQIESIPNQIVHTLLKKTDKLMCEPIASMSVASFKPISEKLKIKDNQSPKKWSLYTKSDSSTKSIKYTSYFESVNLLPIKIECTEQKNIRYETPIPNEVNNFVIKINAIQNSVDLSGLKKLEFYISGALNKALEAIDSIFLGLKKIYLTDRQGKFINEIDRKSIYLKNINEIQRGQLAEGEKIDKMVSDLLFQQRLYSFFTIDSLELKSPLSEFHIVMEMEDEWGRLLMNVANDVKINCIPIINKYSVQPLSINIHEHQHEYEVILDKKKDEHIFGIEKIILVGDVNEIEIHEYNPVLNSTSNEIIHWNMQAAGENYGRFEGKKFMLQILGDQKEISKYKSIFIYCQVTQGFNPESQNSGVELYLNNWDNGYKCNLECANTKYEAPLQSDEINNFHMLLGVKKNINHDLLIDEVKKYINSRDRFFQNRAQAINELIIGLDKNLIACKALNAPVGTMLRVGVQYNLILKRKKDSIISYVVLSKIILEILKSFNNKYDSVFMSMVFEDQKQEYSIP